MPCRQGFDSPVHRQNAFVANLHLVVGNANLDGNPSCVVVVDKCVVNRLADSLARKRVALDPDIVLVGYRGFEILGEDIPMDEFFSVNVL